MGVLLHGGEAKNNWYCAALNTGHGARVPLLAQAWAYWITNRRSNWIFPVITCTTYSPGAMRSPMLSS